MVGPLMYAVPLLALGIGLASGWLLHGIRENGTQSDRRSPPKQTGVGRSGWGGTRVEVANGLLVERAGNKSGHPPFHW
jgi:hypothetical protein